MYKLDLRKVPIEKQNWFCAGWPETKEGLKIISAASGNLIVKGACALLLVVGTVLSAKICGKEKS